MEQSPTIGLVITTYKRLDALELVLLGLRI